MSYAYVRKDVNRFMQNVEERGLMKLFLEALYDEEYFGNCKKLGFSAPPNSVVEIAKNGIDSINWSFANNENMWEHEYAGETRAIAGMGKYVISGKRKSLAGVAIEDIAGAEAKLKDNVVYLKESFDEFVKGQEGEFSYLFKQAESDRQETQAALVLAALSFTMWGIVIVGYGAKHFCYGSK